MGHGQRQIIQQSAHEITRQTDAAPHQIVRRFPLSVYQADNDLCRGYVWENTA